MCLITICGKGTDKTNNNLYDYIKNGMTTNDDGSGIMFKRNGESKITIMKGYVNYEYLIQDLKKLNLKNDDELVIHHRNGTSGLVSAENCHPFVISNVNGETEAKEITTDKPCLVHNGVFWGINDLMSLEKNFSDTFAFTKYILAAPGMMTLYNEDPKTFDYLFSSIIGNDKLCILHPDKDLTTKGNYITSPEGYKHSNSGYSYAYYDRGGHNYYNNVDTFSEGYSTNENTTNNTNKKKETTTVSAKSEVKKDVKNFNFNNFNKIIELTDINYHHFLFQRKTNHSDNFLELKQFDNNCECQLFNYYNTDNKSIKLAMDLDRLYNEYNFVCKNSTYSAIYEDYLILVKEYPSYSKQGFKKLMQCIESNPYRNLIDKIFFKRIGLPVTKKSLIMYRDYLMINSNLNKKSTLQEIGATL